MLGFVFTFDFVLKGFVIGVLAYNFYSFVRLFIRLKLFVYGDSVVDSATLLIRQETLTKTSFDLVKTIAIFAVWICNSIGVVELNLILLYVIFIVMTFLIVNSINNVYGVVYTTADIIDELHVFSLYLRPFASDDIHVSRKQEKWICKEADRYFKLYAIGNPGKVMPSIGAESIFAEDATWKNDVEQLMRNAKYIILRVGDSEGSKWELERDVDDQLEKRTIFLIDSQSALNIFYSVIQPVFSSNLKMPVNGTLAIYFDEKNNCWMSRKIISRKDVKNLMLEYIKSHRECGEVYNAFIEKKKHMLRYLFNSENFPKELGEHRLGFFMNPMLFLKVNKMSIFAWVYAVLLFLVLLACASSYYLIDGVWIILLTCFIFALLLVLMVLLLIFAPRIAWLSRIWPSEFMYRYENFILECMMTDFYKSFLLFSFMPYVAYYVFKWLL